MDISKQEGPPLIPHSHRHTALCCDGVCQNSAKLSKSEGIKIKATAPLVPNTELRLHANQEHPIPPWFAEMACTSVTNHHLERKSKRDINHKTVHREEKSGEGKKDLNIYCTLTMKHLNMPLRMYV